MKFFNIEIGEDLEARVLPKEKETTLSGNPGKGRPTFDPTKPIPTGIYY